jgi:hypothetical protein
MDDISIYQEAQKKLKALYIKLVKYVDYIDGYRFKLEMADKDKNTAKAKRYSKQIAEYKEAEGHLIDTIQTLKDQMERLERRAIAQDKEERRYANRAYERSV